MTPLNTRLPRVEPTNKYVERGSYERQDPFSLEDLGPDTMSRPRGFDEPRNASRRAAEQRTLRGLNPQLTPGVPSAPVTHYPGVVKDLQ